MYGELAPHLTFHNPTCSREGDTVWWEIFINLGKFFRTQPEVYTQTAVCALIGILLLFALS